MPLINQIYSHLQMQSSLNSQSKLSTEVIVDAKAISSVFINLLDKIILVIVSRLFHILGHVKNQNCLKTFQDSCIQFFDLVTFRL